MGPENCSPKPVQVWPGSGWPVPLKVVCAVLELSAKLSLKGYTCRVQGVWDWAG